MKDHTPKLTPCEWADGVLLKRDDLYCFNGIRGGKVRSCLAIARANPGKGLITAGARKSPQMQIVARVGAALGVPVRCHTASGAATPEMADAARQGAVVVQHTPGHNSVICARANQDYVDRSDYHWAYIPFGMECYAAVEANRRQAACLPFKEFKRIVIVLGSGMTAAGILHGLRDRGITTPVLGIQIGADPRRRLDRWAPPMWRSQMRIVKSRFKYSDEVEVSVGGVLLDPHYEAKCVEYLEPNDLFWIVGIRAGLEDKHGQDNK